jgi:hypothetical protein
VTLELRANGIRMSRVGSRSARFISVPADNQTSGSRLDDLSVLSSSMYHLLQAWI